MLFGSFLEPTAKDASEAPFVECVVDFNSDLMSRLHPIGWL